MRLLGLDPGFALTGWALADYDGATLTPLAMGLIRTQKTAKRLAADDNIIRTRSIYRQLGNLLLTPHEDGYTSEADLVCAEAMSYPPNASTAAKMAMTYGAIASICEYTKTPFVQFSPGAIKLAAAGTKKASKEGMAKALVTAFPELPRLMEDIPSGKQEHAIDALGAIVTALDSEVVKMVVRLERKGQK